MTKHAQKKLDEQVRNALFINEGRTIGEIVMALSPVSLRSVELSLMRGVKNGWAIERELNYAKPNSLFTGATKMYFRGADATEVMVAVGPENWDQRPRILAAELRKMLQSCVDHGSTIDFGHCADEANLWPTIDGVEFCISIKLSALQKSREGDGPPYVE